ncbi:MAG: cytochrome d ubiquinol oxidase subunit II [Deltaproteobacteria bacterium]|nr:cytochrome d ubiquinol oxidase subunit II [Deltaproteobacteria bacterium]
MSADASWLQLSWFVLFGALLAGYAVLDGFDLGVGVLSLAARSGDERRLHILAIAPVWDGNEVWLLAAGGALFAAFPPVYAAAMSGFYPAIMISLAALVGRAVAIEFRGQIDSARWRRIWDWVFGVGSLVPAFVFGLAVGNVMRGVPLDAGGSYAGGFLDLLHPYALLVGLQGLAMFVCQGACWLRLKTTGELEARMGRWSQLAWAAWALLAGLSTAATFLVAPARLEGLLARPLLWPVPLLLACALVALPLLQRAGKALAAFLASSLAVVAQVGLAGASLYPFLLPGPGGGGLSVSGASASETSLEVMLVIASIGMPAVIAYTAVIYRVFKGKLGTGSRSY